MVGKQENPREYAQRNAGAEKIPAADKRVGITTTLPIEIVFAAGLEPVDLNNLFIGSDDALSMTSYAETCGFPAPVCNWIKGLYAAVVQEDVPVTVCVTGGDCSNAVALMEVLRHEGRRVEPFEFSYDRSREALEAQMARLAAALGTDLAAAEKAYHNLRPVRRRLAELDRLTWEEDLVTGGENHAWLVSSSDFGSDPAVFQARLGKFIDNVSEREPFRDDIRLAYLGVPPIFKGFYEFLEKRRARVVFNETQRAFSLPWDSDGLVEAYLEYTYPYSIFHRLADIEKELERRSVDAVIHYVQNACHRQISDKIIRDRLDLPVLTIEGERPAELTAQQANRVDAFLEVASNRKGI